MGAGEQIKRGMVLVINSQEPSQVKLYETFYDEVLMASEFC